MLNEFRGTGNVADRPVVRTVKVGAEQRQVAQLRVFFDDGRPDGEGGIEQLSGFWLDVNVWGPNAEVLAQHVEKGAWVHVIGRLAEHRWTVSATGEERRALYVTAERLFLGLSQIAAIEYRPRRETSAGRA